MELVFEILNARLFVPPKLCQKTFNQAGVLIGRADDCDWKLPDPDRHLSNHHVAISYRDDAFFLTDISSNGVQIGRNGGRLGKHVAVRIEHGNTYVLGDFEVCAQLVHSLEFMTDDIGRPCAAGSVIPDDAFFDLDPLNLLKHEEQPYSEIDQMIAPRASVDDSHQRADYARIDMESLMVPQLIEAPPAPAATPTPVALQGQDFWEQFAAALGVDLSGLEQDEREALALNAARLLKQTIGGLQQSLNTRSELKNQLRLAQTTVQGVNWNPLKHSVGADDALGALLQPSKPGQLLAEHAISRAFRDLQAHQVALTAASRAAVRSTLEHFSPEQLTLRFERDNRTLLATAGRRWKAFARYHQALRLDDDWSERLLARDFALAYEEQVRLICSLHDDHKG